MPRQTSDSPVENVESFQRLSLFLARRTGDADYAQILALDAIRWAGGLTQEGTVVPFGSLLAASLRPVAEIIKERDVAEASQNSMAGVIASLPAAEREVLRLVYWDEVSMAELADFLGCSMARAGALLERAYRHAQRKALRLSVNQGGWQ